MTVFIHSQFDSGNIECTSLEDLENIRLRIRTDRDSDFYQWFHFRLSGAGGKPCRMVIENAADAAYPAGWPDYHACASYDYETWFRVETTYRDGALEIAHTPTEDLVWYAYFAPYTYQRHRALINRSGQSPYAKHICLGTTLDGRPIDCLAIIDEERAGRPVLWVIGRQHPGETMAEWWMEGFLARLLDGADPVAR
ncbi:MAG: M14-type cytosolic carboxypeptidase, partial [Pseudomonadota bacterium]